MSQEEFDQAAKDVNHLKSRPKDDELLEIYALFKQATVGDCNTTRPGLLDLKGKAKWDAWNGKKGMSQESARSAYIELVKRLVAEHGLN